MLLDGRDRIRTNPAGEVETKKTTKGGTESAPVGDESEQVAQTVQALEALTPEARDTLLQALGLRGRGMQISTTCKQRPVG
ncbi:MAG: hypothetical protein ACI9JK_000909 [Phycisphaerales bacterium]